MLKLSITCFMIQPAIREYSGISFKDSLHNQLFSQEHFKAGHKKG